MFCHGLFLEMVWQAYVLKVPSAELSVCFDGQASSTIQCRRKFLSYKLFPGNHIGA